MKKKVTIFSFIIVFFSYFSFNASLYWLLVKKTGIGFAYVFDQFSPLLISVSVLFWFFKEKIKKELFITVLKKHGVSCLLIVTIVLLVHGWITGFYFFGEEPTSILAEVITPGSEKLVNILRGYHWGTYVLSYLLFGTHAWMYNIFTLFLFTLASLTLYVFLYIIFRKKIPALLGTLFFVTTPAYLDTFNWQANASGMSLVLLVSIASLIFLLYFQKTHHNTIHQHQPRKILKQ